RVLGGRLEQPLVVRIAADDAVQDDEVGGLDRGRVGGDVVDPPLDLVLEPALAQQSRGFLVVPVRELEVEGVHCATLQPLDLDLADAAAAPKPHSLCYVTAGKKAERSRGNTQTIAHTTP